MAATSKSSSEIAASAGRSQMTTSQSTQTQKDPETTIQASKEEEERRNQIELDVNRTFGGQVYAGRSVLTDSDLVHVRVNLTNQLVSFFKVYGDYLSYYQGFHEVAATLIPFGMIHAKQILPGLALVYLRDFMEPDMTSTLSHCSLILSLLSIEDAQLHSHLTSRISDFNAYFSIPWLLTLFTHADLDRESVLRIFDALICNHPVLLHCISCQVLLSRRKELLECMDMSEVLMVVLKVPDKSTNINDLIQKAAGQLEVHKTSKVAQKMYADMGRCSVVNTYKDVNDGDGQYVIDPVQIKAWSMQNRMKSTTSKSAGSSMERTQWNVYALGLLGLTLMFILSSSSSNTF